MKLAMLAVLAAVPSVLAQGQADSHRPELVTLVRQSVTLPLRNVINEKSPQHGAPREMRNLHLKPTGPGLPKLIRDPLVQETSTPTSSILTPSPLFSFEGTSDADNQSIVGYRVVPPDTEGDVGLNHYVQMNNLVFEIFDKDGNTLYGPAPNNILWAALGDAPCATHNDGDPVVLYDRGVDRWLLSQFAITDSGGHQCLAISATGDPTGVYYLYDYQITGAGIFHDYPKFGVWTDGYYMTANEFINLQPFGYLFNGVIVIAFDRAKLLAGDAPNAISFLLSGTWTETYFGLQPAHWSGGPAPLSGSPATFLMTFDNQAWGSGTSPDGYKLWTLVPNWANPSASTFQSIGQINTADFDSNLCGYNPCIPQPSPGELLDSLSQFTMYRLNYRNLDGVETLVGNHTVDVGVDRAGIRWFELRKTGGTWGLYQTGTYGPGDGAHRWTGSIAMDRSGNIALSYSASSSTDFPSIRYTSRSSSDPLGQLPGGEVVLQAGGGSQTSSYNRWGDYSTISVDPSDECTFWVTNEYYTETGSFDFHTRIGTFSLTGCGGPPPPITTPPAAPSNLTASAGSTGSKTKTWFIDLTWTDNSNNEDGFYIERATRSTGKNASCGTYNQIATAGANQTASVQYHDTTVASSTSYCYRVRAFIADVISGYSNEAVAKTGR